MNKIKGRIKVEAYMDNMGNILVRPVSDRIARKFAKHVREFTGYFRMKVFFQEGFGADEFIKYDIPRRYHSSIRLGYTVYWLEDPWTVGHWYGYDAHTLVDENGEI